MNVSTLEARLLLDAADALRDAEGAHPALYQPAVQRVMALFQADFVAASLWDEDSGRYIESFGFGRDDSIAASYAHYQSIDPFRGFMRARAGRATTLSRAIAEPVLQKSPYYMEHLKHYALDDGVEVALVENQGMVGDFRVWRARSSQRMGEHEELMLELIAPSVLKSLQKFSATRQAAAAQGAANAAATVVHLSPRERQILDLMTAGCTDKVIAQKLGVSFWTVRTHVAALLRKLGAKNRTEAVALHR